MAIITLTTDMGSNDHYVASLKGAILKAIENPHIIDITHEVRPFDTAEAAYHVSSCYKDFPDGTVHLIGVDSEPVVNFGGSDGCFPSILEFHNQYFVCNDNGFFGVFLQQNKAQSFWRIDDVLSNPKLFKFPTKNMLIGAVTSIINGTPLSEIASPQESFRNALAYVATSELNLIKGHVVHCDSYGNAITNIHKSLFDRYGNDTPFIIRFKKSDYFIDLISISYNEVPPGEKVAVFNSNDLLEIAINRGASKTNGGAEQLFGLNKNDVVRVEFTPKGSKETIEDLFS